MTTARLVSASLRAIGRYKLRSGFMMMGSLVGVAALTFVVSVGQGVESRFLTMVRQVLGDSALIVMGGGSRLMGNPRGDLGRLTVDDLVAVARAIPDVQAWDPQANLSMSVKYRDVSTSVEILGGSERAEQVWGRGVMAGRYFDATDVNGAARVALIGPTTARVLFGDQSPLDTEIRIGSVPFRIIGVLEPFGIDMHGMDRDNQLVVPLSSLMRRLTNTDTIATAKFLIADPSRADVVAQAMTRVLRDRHGLAAAQPDDFRVVTAAEARRNVAMIRRIFYLYIPLVAAVALVVGGIVSATLMLSSINARFAEIGIRRAVGARPEDIGRQFLIETAITTIAGGVAGIVVGYGAAAMIAAHMAGHVAITPTFSWVAVLIALAASAITGLLAGVMPARRAARLQPVDALR